MVYGIFRMERIQAAEKYFPADLLYDDYVYILINRRYKLINSGSKHMAVLNKMPAQLFIYQFSFFISLHWFLAIITPR